ncbi:MAG TPA: glycerophosphodiester phosphodiesterase [Dongiaceae bacterium]|nr:glycerophosphodiester phosphodiesterase [Dongiaceae bacterium]
MRTGLLTDVVGHRGAAAGAPENTLASLALAAEQGARMVEFDVKLTADGALILMHDETLERTTTGRGQVAETPLARIRELDAGAWRGPAWRHTPVPTLEEAVAILDERDLSANIEIKPCPGRDVETAEATVDLLRRAWPRHRPWPLLSSFSRASLAAARDRAPEIPRGLLLWGKPSDWSAAARSLGCLTVHCAQQHLTPEWAAEIGRLGYGLAAYTVNDPADAARLRGWGVDSIITDDPGALIAAGAGGRRRGFNGRRAL